LIDKWLQVERRTGNVCWSKTNILPLSHAANQTAHPVNVSALLTCGHGAAKKVKEVTYSIQVLRLELIPVSEQDAGKLVKKSQQ